MQPLQYDSRPSDPSDAKHKSITLAAAAARNHDAAIPMRSADTEIAKPNRIATRYCRTHRLDAAVPMHKVSQHMQSTMFRANPNIQIASMIHENEAFVRGFLQITRVDWRIS